MLKRRRGSEDVVPGPTQPAKYEECLGVHPEGSKKRRMMYDGELEQAWREREVAVLELEAATALCESMRKLTLERTHCALLELPAELRNHIYRMTFEGDQDIFTIRSCVFPEPALLSVCKQIRREAGSVYFDHIFIVEWIHYACEASLVFSQKEDSVLKEFNIVMDLDEHEYDDTSNWQNLLDSFRRQHKGLFTWNLEPDQSISSFTRDNVMTDTIESMLMAVMQMRDLPWCQVEPVLDQQRKVLISTDARWA